MSRLTALAEWGVVIATAFEGVWALLQLLGMVARGHALFPATGSFYNPGPLCGFMALGVPVAVGWVLSADSRVREWTGWVMLLLCAAVMPALMGRTGWVAAAVGSAVVWGGLRWESVRSKRWVRPAIGAGIALIIAAGAGLYLLKPGSARGRMLMWRVGVEALIDEGGATGIGWHRVAGALGRAQEEYFASGRGSASDAEVAGAPDYAFNEFVQIGIAYGWVGLAVFIASAVWTVVTSWRGRAFGIAGAAVALLVVCCGSYPLQFVEFWLAAGLMMAGAAGAMKRKGRMRCVVAAVVMAGCVRMGWLREEDRLLSREWQGMRMRYVNGRLSPHSAEELKRLGSLFGESHRYLFDAGKALRESGRLDESDSMLLAGLERSSDPMFLNLLGRNARERGEAAEAERYFRRAEARIPSRLYPRYLLALLYADTICGPDTVRCVAEAEAALAMEVKVESPATRDMRAELRELIGGVKNEK